MEYLVRFQATFQDALTETQFYGDHFLAALYDQCSHILKTGDWLNGSPRGTAIAHDAVLRAQAHETLEWPWGMFLMLTFGLFIFTWAFRFLVVQPLARVAMGWYAGRRISDTRVKKFASSFVEASFFFINSIFSILLMPSQPWLWPSHNWWRDQPNNYMSEDITFFFLLSGAFYAQALLSIMLEHRRKDFWEMLIHHFVTVSLVCLAFVYGWVRGALVVRVIFDFADPWLHLAKQVKYFAELRNYRGLFTLGTLTDLFFAQFILIFFITRLLVVPYIAWSSIVEMYQVHSKIGGYDTIAEHVAYIGTPVVTGITLLLILIALQIFWFGLIIKVLIKIAKGHLTQDERSDGEMSDMEPNKKKKE